MRKYLVLWNDANDFIKDEVELPEGYKANPETFASIINNTLNHYKGYYCYSNFIYGWSLIEE